MKLISVTSVHPLLFDLSNLQISHDLLEVTSFPWRECNSKNKVSVSNFSLFSLFLEDLSTSIKHNIYVLLSQYGLRYSISIDIKKSTNS